MTNENGYIIVRLHKRNENRNEKHLKNNKKHEKCSKKKGEKMFRTVVKIDGMMCGMCEAHINDAIRRNFNVKKVKSSHSKGETVIESETEPDAAALKRAIEETGYEFISASTKIIEGRRGLFAGILHKD